MRDRTRRGVIIVAVVAIGAVLAWAFVSSIRWIVAGVFGGGHR